jgi:hypothetical protein
MAGDGMLEQCREVVAGLGVALHLQLTGGGPDVDVLAAVVAEGLKGGFIAPVALEMEKGDQSLLI